MFIFMPYSFLTILQLFCFILKTSERQNLLTLHWHITMMWIGLYSDVGFSSDIRRHLQQQIKEFISSWAFDIDDDDGGGGSLQICMGV